MTGRYISNDIGSVSSVEIFPKEEVLSLTKLYFGEAYMAIVHSTMWTWLITSRIQCKYVHTS